MTDQDYSDYPLKTCEIDRLVTHPQLIAAALRGQKTQQRRNGVYAYPGETFTLESTPFVITALRRQTLGDMTEADALAEGFPDLHTYKQLILRMHKGMPWDDDHPVWVHCFEKTDA